MSASGTSARVPPPVLKQCEVAHRFHCHAPCRRFWSCESPHRSAGRSSVRSGVQSWAQGFQHERSQAPCFYRLAGRRTPGRRRAEAQFRSSSRLPCFASVLPAAAAPPSPRSAARSFLAASAALQAYRTGRKDPARHLRSGRPPDHILSTRYVVPPKPSRPERDDGYGPASARWRHSEHVREDSWEISSHGNHDRPEINPARSPPERRAIPAPDFHRALPPGIPLRALP